MLGDGCGSYSDVGDRALVAPGAGENVVKGVTEQADDGVELLIPDCHRVGKIAFDEQRQFVVTLAQSAGKRNVVRDCPRRQRL